MKDIGEVFLKFGSIIIIPVFVIFYALYGFRVWCWNFIHSSAGEWVFKIPNQPLQADGQSCALLKDCKYYNKWGRCYPNCLDYQPAAEL